MDEVLKRSSINRAAQFGGTIGGNGARTLMEMCHVIIDEIEEHFFAGANQSSSHR
jgi:hypothetical protein